MGQRLRRVEEEARERKEREREEMRRRAAAHKPDTEAWWLKYGAASSAGDKQREIGKLKAHARQVLGLPGASWGLSPCNIVSTRPVHPN